MNSNLLFSCFKFTFACTLVVSLVGSSELRSQELFLKNQLGDLGGTSIEEPVTLSGQFKLKKDSRMGVLSLTANINEAWHIFSMTQQKGGPIKSKIAVAESNDYKVIGDFKADVKPHVVENVEGFDVPVEEHEGQVTFAATIELKEGVDPKNVSIKMVFNGQVCESKPNGSCRLLSNMQVDAKFAGYDADLKIESANSTTGSFTHKPIKLEEYFPEHLHVSLTGRVVRADGTKAPFGPGDKVNLEITAKSLEDYHVYAYSLEKISDYIPTIVGFTETNKWKVKGPKLSAKPEKGDSFGSPVLWHHEPIIWTFEIEIPKTAESKTYPLKGIIGLQACNETGCDRPTGVEFSAEIAMGNTAEVPLKWIKTESKLYGAAKKAIQDGGAAEAIKK